ncbi:hypothetical protein [uncultured Mucilaginibacter sp.]|uniref:hypothetical protein n=1 Tax=uncultured Mucilaginibacter sp. TaxID=797541 RepID=UPI0025E9FA0F|nr:hypothetical protein [uncultured Mucilaginibacter sp.]
MKLLLKYLLFTLMIFAGYEVFSQPPASFRSTSAPSKKLNLIREGYIETQIKLSNDEKAKFWPVYREYKEEVNSIRKAKLQNRLNKSKDQIQKDLEYDQQLVDAKKHYTKEFLKILPPDKVNRVFQSEREFTEELIKQLGERGTPDR